MKVLLDTNVVLDAVACREPFRKEAEQIVMLAANEALDCYITANTITDIYYITRKYFSDAITRDKLRYLFTVFSVLDLYAADCENAINFPLPDYEDAILALCAQKNGVDYIITRDGDFLDHAGTLPVISPKGFLDTFMKL
ncbi:DNA-binding protein [Spirochaetia bacterium]|nr:DNA-binding protein [Spirochaetia bacterium]